MIKYANPLYDTVFKYLIEDLGIAKELLSIILDLEVIQLEVQSQEISASPKPKAKKTKTDAEQGNPKTLLRYDFKARVKTKDGIKKILLLELQKRKNKSIIFRFRNYIGRNYMSDLGNELYEQVYIYLTGFPIDYTQELPPYLWCRRQLVDGMTGELFFPNKDINFVNQMTHESCFIHVNGFAEDDPHPLAQIMNLFNQKRKMENEHFLEITPPEKGTLMARIVERLNKATHDEELMKAIELEAYYEYDMQGLEDDNLTLRKEAEEERHQKEEERRQKEEERRQKLMLIQSLLAKGFSHKEIALMAGLSEEDIINMLK